MGTDDTKSHQKPGATNAGETPERERARREEERAGRVKFDDRGNAKWEWAENTGSFATDSSSARLKKLDNPSLSIADDAPTPVDTVRANPLGTKKGYDPYDSGKLGKTAAAARKKDLRRLSEWLKLKKQADTNKKQPPDDE